MIGVGYRNWAAALATVVAGGANPARAEKELARMDEVKLVPGMPVDVFLQTDARTLLSYLIQPLHDQISRAFQEK